MVAPLEALNAARALSEALVTMIQSAQAMLSVAASGGEIDAETLAALREAVGLDGATGENLVTAATEMSAVVNAAIAAATTAKTDAVNAAGSGIAAARTAAATSFSTNINAKLAAAGATTTDINNLQNVVDIVTTKVTAIRDIVSSKPDLPSELLSVLNLAVQAADAADQAATAAQGTLNTTDPAVMLTAKAGAVTAAQTVNGLKAQAITALDAFVATRTVDPAVIAQFQQAVQDANTAESAADTATAAIEGASQAREAAQAFKDGTAQADLTTKQAATTAAQTTATAEKAEAVTAAGDVLAARANLLTKLVDEAVDKATFEAFEDAAKSAEAIQKGASDGDKGDVVADADGGLTYTVDTGNAAIAALNPGDSTTDTFKIAIENDSGGFDLQTITVTITNVDGTITVSDDVTLTSGSGDTLTTVSGTLSGLTADGVQQNLDAAEAALAAATTALDDATAAGSSTPTLAAALALATQNKSNAEAAVEFQEEVFALFQNAAQTAQARARGIGDGDKGEVTFDADGNVVYTPDADAYADLANVASATDTFLIAAQNSAGGYDISTVQVTVTNNAGTLAVGPSTTVTAPDSSTATIDLDALDDVTAGNPGYINGADQVADASTAVANAARTTVANLETVAQAELTESLAAINALATAQSAEAQAEGYLAVAQASAEAQADAALEIAVDDIATVTNQLSLLASAVNAYADAAQANAIVGTADKVAANAAANSALEALLDAAVNIAGFNVTTFLASDTAGGNADLQARTDILDFPAAATSDPALRTQVATAEAEVRDALISSLDSYIATVKTAVTNAANLSYASQSAEAVAARAAALASATAQTDRAEQLIDLAKAKSVLASAAADLADFINPEPDSPEAAFAALALSEKQETVADEGLVSATAGPTADTIVITGNVSNQTFTVNVSASNGGATDDNDGTAVLTTATTETGSQVTTVTILGTPEIGDTYTITISADLDPDAGAVVAVNSTIEITVDAELTTVAALREALVQAINFDETLGGAQGQEEAAAAAEAAAVAAAAAKAAADLAAYNETLGYADAAVADAATAEQQAAIAAELALTAQQAAQDAATAEAANNAEAAEAAAVIAETAAAAAAIAEQAAAAAATSAELNGNRAIQAASGAGSIVVNGQSTSASAQANRASQAASSAAAAAGAALQSLDNAEASASDARSDADLQSAEDRAAELAEQAAADALAAADQAAADAQAAADQAAAQRAAAQAVAAEEAGRLADEAEAQASDDDPATQDAAQAAATAQSLATSNIPGAADLAADAAEAARNAANQAQTAADAAQAAALGKGSAAQAEADRAQAAATAAAISAGEAEAAAQVAANADAAVEAWTSGDASGDRATAALAARDAAAAAARASAAAETANATAEQATADAVAPNVALAAAEATVTSRTNSLAQVRAERDAADDGDDDVDTAIEQVWDNAVAQAEQALSDAEDALAQAQAAADAANENVTIAQANADAASQAAAEAASQAAQAASQASFAAAFEINAQGAAQTRVDNFLDSLADEIAEALASAKAQATTASQQAVLATTAAAGATPDADAAAAAATAAAEAAQAALDALLQAAEDLDLPISAETAQAVIDAINSAADTAAALDDLDDGIQTTDNLRTVQDAADATQLAAIASIKAAAASAQQAVAAANAALLVAQKQAAVAAADEAGLDAARIEAAEAALDQAKADAQAAADQAAADSAEAASAQASAQTRVSDIQAIATAAASARTAATTAELAATDASTSLSQAQTALTAARSAADDAQADFTASAAAQTIDPAAYQAVKQANDRAQAALQDALDAVADAQAAYASASDAATTADAAADLAEVYRDGGTHPDTGATIVGVNLAAAQAALTTATSAATAAQTAANTAAAEAAEAAGRTAASAELADIQAAADAAAADATAADAAATTAETQAGLATAALANIPRAAAARSAAQAAADEAQAAVATAEGVAQTDTVTLDGTIEDGDVYRVTIDGDVVAVTVGTDTAAASTGITIADVRTALVNAINDAANGVTDSVVASAGSGDGAITLTAAMPGVGFTATASATNNGANDDQSATASTVTGNLGGATQVAQLDTVTLQGTVQAGDTYSVTVNGTVVSLTIPTDNSITTLTQVRDALITLINDSAAADAVTAAAGDTDETLAITADVAGVAFTAMATATDGGGNTDNAAQAVTTTANLRGADDLAAQAATDAQTAATTAESEAAKADTAAKTAAASIAAKDANDDAVGAAGDAATQATTAKQAAADAALHARTAKAVGDAVSEVLSRDSLDNDDLLDAIEAQLETTQVTRVTLSGAVETGDKFFITVGTTSANFTVTTQTTLSEVRDAFIQQLTSAGTFDGIVTVSQGATADSIRLTGVTPGTAFTTTASATNATGGTNDQAARVQRQVNADQVTQQDTVTVDGDTVVADGDSFSINIAGTPVTVSTASGLISVGDDADAVRDALVTAIQNAGIAGITVAAGGTGALVLTATQAGAAGAFLTSIPNDSDDALSLDAISNGSVADSAADSAATASESAQSALAIANAAGTTAGNALTAAQAAVAQEGAGSVAQAFLTDTQSQVTATNSSVASAARDAAAAAQSAASAQAQADLAGTDGDEIADLITAANTAAIRAADEDADTAAEAAEAAFSQATASSTAALTKAEDAITDAAEMLQLATSFDQVTLTGTPAADNVFSLTIDPTPGDADNGDAVTVEVTAQDGDTINDIRDALVDAVNSHANLQGVAQASASSGSGGFVVAATTSGSSIGVTVTENGDATGAESASGQILNALAAADAAKTTIEGLLADGVQDGDGDATATALDNAVTALDAAIAATRQTVSVTIGGTVEAGDTLSVAFDTNNDGTADVTKTITVGANPTLASVRDALVTEIATTGGMTASAALQDGELVLISDDPAASFIRVTVSAVNEDGVAGEAPTISAARTGTEAALRALKNGLQQASDIAETIEAVVDIAGTAAGTARAAAEGLAPAFDTNGALTAESAATIVTTANTLGSLSPALDPSVPADVVTAAQLLAEIAEGYVPDALSGAATANAQATIAQQAAFQAASGLAQFEQAIIKARNEAELRIQQEARDSAPVAGDDVIGDGDATNGGPVSGDDEVLEDQAITFDVLGNDKRADGGDLTNAAIAAVGQPSHGKITIVPEVRELNFGPAFTDGDQITLTINGTSVTYTLTSLEGLNAEGNAALFVDLINGTPAMAAVVSAVSAGRGGAITLTSAVPGTPIVTSVATQGDVTADADTITVPNGRVTYTPDANYNGTDTFTYTVSNGANPPSFDTATVTIDITPTNDNPDAKNDFITTADDSTAISKTAAAGLLANDTDIDTGDSLSIIKVNGSTVGVAQNVNFTLPNGDPVVAQVTINADGSYTVNPNGQFEPLAAGQSATGTLTYTVSDGHAGTDDQTISLANTVANASGVNQVSTYTVGGTIERGDVFEVTVNGTRISHTVTDETTANEVRDAIVAKLNANGAIAGKVTASAGGGGEVVITANLAGQAFTTSAQAINAGTDVATLTVTITGSNDAPTADADTASGDEDTTITGTLTANDPDLGDTLTFAVAGGGQAANGTVTIQSNGAFSYVPNTEFSGTDSFTFRVTDAAGIASTATVTITVNNVNDDPVITAGGDPAPTFAEGGDAVVIDGSMEIADVDTANFNTGYLRAQVTDNLDPGDHLLIQEAGGITLSGADVLFNGVVIGTIDGTDDGSAANLLITLDADATPAAVQALARTIAFTNDAAEPTTVARTVTFTVDSGDGGTTTQDATVQVALESGLTRSDHNQLNFSGDWFDAANWTSGLPDATTIAVINDGGYAPITFNNGPVNETVGQLVVNADLNILAGTLNVLEPSEIGPAATMTVSTASVLGTGDLNIAGTVALSGGATLGLPLISLDAIANDSIAGGMTVTGSGNQINGALAIEADSVYVGQLILGGTGSGNVALDVALGIVNDGDIIIDNSDAAPADTVLTVGGPGIVNSRNIIFSDTSGGGGQRIIEGSIDTANGTITVDASATIDLAGGILNAAAGTIDLATATVLTVSDGQTIVDGDTYLSGTGALDLAGTGSLTLTSNFALNSGAPELTLSGEITIDGVGAPTLTIGDGRNLTLDGDIVSGSVNLNVDGTLTIEGTGTVIAAPTVINSPNGAFTVAPDATVTITAPGFLSNNGGEISVGAGATLILDGVNLENAGVITGEGTIQLANGADIAGDGIIEVAGVDNIGTLDITGGPLNLDPGASVNIDVTDNVTHDVLHLDTMDLTAAGDTLNLTFAPDFDPTTDGNSFQVLTYSGHTAEIGGDGAVLEAGIDNIFDTIQHNLGPEYTVTIDYGSTAATVTVNRNPEIAVTTNGAGMQFDGIDDIIRIPADGTVNALTSITVEAVVTLTELPAGVARIAENFSGNYDGWGFTIHPDGTLSVEVGNGGGSGQLSNFYTVPGAISAGDPSHVAFTYDELSGDIAVYVNGIAIDGTPGGANPEGNLGATTSDVLISHPAFPLKGVIDEFRIYDEARTPLQVADDAGGGGGGTPPLVYFDFANGQAVNLGSQGSASDGILDNGLGGAALAFDGSDDFVQGDTAGIDFGNAFSIEFVVQTEMATTGYIMTIGDTFSGGVTANNLLFANIPSAAGNLRIGQYGVIDINSTTLVNDGVPHHVSLTHDGAGNYKLYIDGVLEQSPPTTSVPNITGSTLVLGDAIASQPAFDGAIGDFRIYSDERNATEIAADATGAVDTDNLQIHYDIDAADVADGTITNQGALGSSADATVGTVTGVDAADPTVIDIVNPVAPLAVPLVGQALSFDGTVSIDAVDASVIDFTASGGNTLQFFAATDEIVAGQVGTFANLVAGQTITISGSMTANDATFTIADVSADGTTITVQETGSIVGTTALSSGANIVSETTSPLATGTGAFTYEAWFRTDDPANPQTIIRVGDPAGDYAQIRVTGDGRVQALAPDAGQTTLESSLGTNDGLWHHVAYTHDGAGNLELFLDGVSVATTTAAINSIDAGSMTIGGYLTANQPFFGEIFDVRAYDVARSQADILLDMNQLPTGAEPNLTGAWHLDDVLNGTTDQFRDVTGNGGTGTYSGGTPVFADNNLFTMAEDSVLHGQIIATDADDVNDTEVFTFGVAAQGANGTVTVNPADGTWEYTPNTDFFGTDSFEVQVTDSGGATATKTVSVSVLNVNDAPSVETASGAATFAEDGAPVIIDPALTITDLDSADFDGGSLTIEISGGYQAGDVLAIDAGAAFDLSSGMTNGSLISIGQDVIGVINLDGATGTLSIDLTDFATPGVVEQLARAVTFQNDTEEPGAGSRGIDFTLTDGDGGTSATLSQSVNITPVNDAPEVTTATLPAGTATFDAEVLVNTALTGEQSAADVTYFANGTKFVVTWNNYSVGGGSDLGTIGRIFNADGTPDGPEFIIANTAPGSEYNARVSPMTDGGFIVSYVNQPTAADATTSDLYVQRYDSTGQAVSRDGATPGADAFNVGEYFSGTVQNGGTVVGLSNGGFVIAIDQQDPGIATGQDVTARVFGPNGAPVTGEFLLGSSPIPATQGTELAALPGGGFVAVWTDNTDGDNDLFAQVYDNSGTPLGAEFAVAVNQGGGTQQDQHEVATLSNGNFAVAWRTDDIASGDNDGNGGIGLRIFGPDGTPVTGDLLANTDITGHQNEPSIAALPDGGFVVSWSTNDIAIDGDGTAIRAQRFDAAGAKVGTEFTVNENTAGNQQQSAIAADADGNLIAVFRQSDPVGATADNTEIGARVISFGLDGKTYVEDGAPLVVDSGITLTDVDSATLDGAMVTITTAFEANTDILSFTPVGAIGGSYDAAAGALTLTGTGTVAEYEQVLRSVTFSSTAVQPDLADRTIEFQVTDDQGAPSTPFAVTIGVENTNDAPTVASAGPAADFTEDGAPVIVDPTVQITDPDSTDFDGGTLTIDITGGYQIGDVLAIDAGAAFDLSSGMTNGSLVSIGQDVIGIIGLDGASGTLSIDLTAFATPGVVEQLARAVTFQNDTVEPGTDPRGIDFTLTDGDGGTSATLSQTVTVSPVNDAPEILGVVQSSNAAQFNGIGDSISLANPVGLPNGAADFTWSAWVKTDATAVNHAILSVGNATGTGTNGQLFIQANGQLAFDSLNVNFVTGGPAINDDAWHHVAVTTSGGFSEIFVDGVSVAAPVDLSLAIGTDSAFIGQAPDGTNQFDGEISDVRIYDV
ncbi:MAG: hypothetical protein CMF68_11655, partial [Magnetovibrio sp.]|nr:hypothetical protein [Magnetovibrio sp.]